MQIRFSCRCHCISRSTKCQESGRALWCFQRLLSPVDFRAQNKNNKFRMKTIGQAGIYALWKYIKCVKVFRKEVFQSADGVEGGRNAWSDLRWIERSWEDWDLDLTPPTRSITRLRAVVFKLLISTGTHNKWITDRCAVCSRPARASSRDPAHS